MQEQEWNFGREEPLLPDGWSEGEDLFAGAEEAPLPTTEGAEDGVPAAGGADAPPRTYKLKVNHEEKEVTLSEEEVVARLQKSYAFDAMKERREGARDYAEEVRQLQRLYPDFTEIPDEVAHLAAQGESLISAYAVWQGRQAEKAAQTLREENRVLKQNASAAARAPVKGVRGSGPSKGAGSDFERGFESVAW